MNTLAKNQKVGISLGIGSIVPVICSVILYYTMRGPNVDLPFVIKWHSIFGVVGLILAITSFIISRPPFISKISLVNAVSIILNLLVLVIAFLLQMAVGISEP
jgi:hypothetical protein